MAGAADRLKAAVKGEFLKCEKALITALDGVSGLEFDGSTATLVLRVEDRLICAWLGDSRALVGNRSLSLCTAPEVCVCIVEVRERERVESATPRRSPVLVLDPESTRPHSS